MYISRKNRLGFKLDEESLGAIGSKKLMITVSPESARDVNEHSLLVVTEDSWREKYLPLIERLPSSDAEARKIQRLMLGHSIDINVKRERLKISDTLMRLLYVNESKVIFDRVSFSLENVNIYIRPISNNSR